MPGSMSRTTVETVLIVCICIQSEPLEAGSYVKQSIERLLTSLGGLLP